MNLDWIILNKIQEAMSSGFMDMIMPKITLLGSAGIIWIIIGVALLISKKHRRTWNFYYLGISKWNESLCSCIYSGTR